MPKAAKAIPVKLRRSYVAGKKPSSLKDGELSINLADSPESFFIGTNNGVRKLFDVEEVEDAEDDAVYGRCNGDWVQQPAVSDDPPENPKPNQVWVEGKTLKQFIRLAEAWVQLPRF